MDVYGIMCNESWACGWVRCSSSSLNFFKNDVHRFNGFDDIVAPSVTENGGFLILWMNKSPL